MSLFNRKARSGVLLNLTDNFIQLARIVRLDEKPLDLDHFAELSPDDETGTERWLQRHFGERRRGQFYPGYCGFHPTERVMVREIITPRRLNEPGYVHSLLAEHAKISGIRDWTVAALNPMDGTPLAPEGNPRHALLFGVPWSAIRKTQERLLDLGIRPRRLEVSTLGMLGCLTRHRIQSGYAHAIAVCEIEHTQTRLYLLAKDGVHILASLPHGLLSITEAAMKELDAPDVATARQQLEAPSEALVAQGRRFMRAISRHFKPAVDHFELKTGHRIDALHCTQLPSRLTWLADALGAAVDLALIQPNVFNLFAEGGLKVSDEGEPITANWMSSLSLVSQLAPPATTP
ncbi:MAG: hypothetical protein KA257_02785 [Opitutaceae bacterium]|nr:hypothetical protein [Opitutaceae bacterium]